MSVDILSFYLAELEADLERLDLHAGGPDSAARSHWNRASEHFVNAREILRAAGSSRSLVAEVVRARVALDVVRHPEIGAEEGWVELQTDEKSDVAIVDTQLMRGYLGLGGGGIVAGLQYKPRKIDLVPARVGQPFAPILECAIVPGIGEQPTHSFAHAARLDRTAHTPTILSLRVNTRAQDVALSTALDFHAGLGAYMANATTGFNAEFECEEGLSESDGFLRVGWGLRMQSGSHDALSVFPLQSVGGVADTRLEHTKETRLFSREVPGGLYGLRCIDGIASLTLDLRTARPLAAIDLCPIAAESSDGGHQLYFYYSLADVLDAAKSASLFLSIY